MWVEFMTVRNAYIAATWQELFAAEALSTRVVPPIGVGERAPRTQPRTLYVPTGKAHVAREILRKI
jgi:hypothetical protein